METLSGIGSPDRRPKQRALPRRKKPEDTAQGCRAYEADDRARAVAAMNGHIRSTMLRSAEAWAARAGLLERLETKFRAQAKAIVQPLCEPIADLVAELEIELAHRNAG